LAVPKRKKSRAKRDSRRAHHKKVKQYTASECPQCHQPKMPHHVCPECGHYDGKQVLEVK